MPARATFAAPTLPIGLPSKTHLAVSAPRLKVVGADDALSNPVSRLKKVVLPAPFGPISAVMAPRCTSTCCTSTAVMPPKRRTTLSTVRIESGLADPGVRSTLPSLPRSTSRS